MGMEVNEIIKNHNGAVYSVIVFRGHGVDTFYLVLFGTTIGLYFTSATLRYPPPGRIMIFYDFIDFHAHSLKSITGNDAILVSG